MREYWDRFIRDREHYVKALEYIHQNPVKAGLCSEAAKWRWSGAHAENAGIVGKIQTDKADGDVGAPRAD